MMGWARYSHLLSTTFGRVTWYAAERTVCGDFSATHFPSLKRTISQCTYNVTMSNHCCNVKAMSITYYECAFVALGI